MSDATRQLHRLRRPWASYPPAGDVGIEPQTRAFRSGYQEKTPTKLPLSSLPHRQLEPRGGTRQLKWFEHNERIHVTARRVIEGERENANDLEAQ